MKNGLGNLAARDVSQLAAIVRNRLKRIQYRPALISGFLAKTGLTLEPEPPWASDPGVQPLYGGGSGHRRQKPACPSSVLALRARNIVPSRAGKCEKEVTSPCVNVTAYAGAVDARP